jgi:hypothetical protein
MLEKLSQSQELEKYFPEVESIRRNSENIAIYRVFQNELHNFESLYKFIKRACAVF